MFSIYILIALVATINALNNGLGLTPQMGYNSWYDLYMSPDDNTVRQTVKAMKDTGLYAAGYRYVNLDDGMVTSRDPNTHVLIPDPKFPKGFKSLSDHIHSQGMLFGIYTDRGPKTCGGRPGSQGYEQLDATTYAAWGVDYVKEDSCNAPSDDHAAAYKQYATMRDALNATKRSIFFSLCGWYPWYAPVGRSLGNSWRTGPDDSNWPGILQNIDLMAPLWSYSGVGGWNDPCLLLGRDSQGNYAVTELQSRAQFSMWAVMASPLLLSQNIRNLSSYQLATYLNAEVIAVSQDRMGRQGMRLVGGNLWPSADEASDDNSEAAAARANIWGRPLADGSWAFVFINAENATSVALTCGLQCFSETGWGPNQPLTVRDLWLGQNLPSTTPGQGIKALLVPNGGVMMYRVKPILN